MANIRSMKKDLRRNAKRQARNKDCKSALKTYAKKVRQAAVQHTDGLDAALVSAVSAFDKAAKRGIIHKNTAARKKSRLALTVNKAKAG